MATTNWIILAVRWSVKYYFASNSSIFIKSLDEGRKQRTCKAQTQTSKQIPSRELISKGHCNDFMQENTGSLSNPVLK